MKVYVALIMMTGVLAQLASGCATRRHGLHFDGTYASAQKKFSARVYTNAQGESIPYRFLKPLHYNSARAYPLILFLHGAGERGSDDTAICKFSLPEISSTAVMKRYPCFVIAPQVPKGQKWVNVDWSALSTPAPAEPSRSLRLTMDLLQQVRRNYHIDARRIYVTGLSMGGYGTWDVIWRHPDLFAAAVPVCGGGDPSKAPLIAKLPIWDFHGGADRVVPTEKSRAMVAALKAVGSHVKYTEYPGVNHNSWSRAYTTPALYQWLFAQRRKQAAAE